MDLDVKQNYSKIYVKIATHRHMEEGEIYSSTAWLLG
jgi:hypothetical protein